MLQTEMVASKTGQLCLSLAPAPTLQLESHVGVQWCEGHKGL